MGEALSQGASRTSASVSRFFSVSNELRVDGIAMGVAGLAGIGHEIVELAARTFA